MSSAPSAAVGVVVIGRNEGERLRQCLESVAGSATCVYVDSGSTDGSTALAETFGADVVLLEEGTGFTAARARNVGFRRLHELQPGTAYVQFVDGDCEIMPQWLFRAAVFLEVRPDVALVCGRLRERYPERSLYNMLCDIEWDGALGEIRSCGGNAMARATAFEASGGFREDLIAGEEPELCVRLRAAGWRIWRLGADMAWHDAAMTHFAQWWRRAVRAGYAAALGMDLHGAAPERHGVRQSRSALLWGIALPLVAVLLALRWRLVGALLLVLYPIQVVRLALRGQRRARENWWHALFLVLGKFPQALGNLKYQLSRRLGRHQRLIEYK